jgi:hypothetical protein
LNRLKRLCAITAGAFIGFALALVLARLVKPFWPVPRSGVGFVTVNKIPKGIDDFRFVLVLLLVPAGMFVVHHLAGDALDSAARPIDAGAQEPKSCPRWLVFSAAIVLAGIRIAASPGIHGPIDLFHEGHHLAPAGRVLSGGAFYRDVVPYHGLLADGGLDAAAFRLFGETLAVSRRLHVALDAFFFAAAAVAFGFALPGAASFLASIFLLVGLTDAFGLPGSFPFYRTLPLLLSAVATVRFVQKGRRRSLVFAGAASSLGLFWSLEIGLFALFSLAVWLIAERLIADKPFPVRDRAAPIVTGATLGVLPFFALLSAQGAWRPFLHDSYFILRSAGAVWGFPAPGAREVATLALDPFGAAGWEAVRFHAPALLFGAMLGYLVIGGRVGSKDLDRRILLALLLFSIVGYRSALGRVSFSHTRYSMVVPSLLISFALGQWFRLPARRPRFRWIAGILIAGSFLLYSGFATSLRTIARRLGTGSSRLRGDGLVPLGLERSGGVRVPEAQAESIESFGRYVRESASPGETFYDFSNSPALYFLLEQNNPVRVLDSADLSADSFENEALAILEARRPAFIVVSCPQGVEKFDGVANAERCPKLWEWIGKNYPGAAEVGGFGIRTRW